MEFQFQTPNNNNSARNIFKEENAFRENLKLISQNNTLYNNSNNYNIKPLTNTSLFSSQKEAEEETKLKSLLTKISNIFSEILSKYESEQSILYSILKEIIYSIKLIISEFSSNKETLENDNINNKSKSHYLNTDSNSKVVLQLKIEKLNKKIQLLTNEIQTMKNCFNITNGKNTKNYYVYFLKKLTAIKSKYQDNELKYLLYIEEQKNKITNLEKELEKHIKKDLPKDVSKAIRCFPHCIQYNVKEYINPKTVPLSQMKITKNKIYHSTIKTKIPKFLFDSENNSNSSRDNKIFKTECNINNKGIKDEILLFNGNEININKSRNHKFENTSTDNKNKERAKTYNKISQNNRDCSISITNITPRNSYEKNLKIFSYNNKKVLNKNEIIKNVNDYKPNILINKKKEFYISHPNIKLAEIEKEKTFNTILRKVKIKFSKYKNINKNSFIIFPTYLNETLANLEKFRKNKLIIDNDLEENNAKGKK